MVFLLSSKTKPRVCLFSLLRLFDELFDVINDDLFLTLKKTPALVHFGTKLEKKPLVMGRIDCFLYKFPLRLR